MLDPMLLCPFRRAGGKACARLRRPAEVSKNLPSLRASVVNPFSPYSLGFAPYSLLHIRIILDIVIGRGSLKKL